MNSIVIIDYGLCNLDSVARAVEECGGKPIVTDQSKDLEIANRIILPGVGAFPNAMSNIRELRLEEPLYEQAIVKQIPFLGICLGMQLLAEWGHEVEKTRGLGWIPGEVIPIEPFDEDTRIPHIGWNEVWLERQSHLFHGIDTGKDFYFVHSYHLHPYNEQFVLARTPYAKGFACAVQRENIFGVQFHPEKSQRLGFQVLKNFLDM